MKYLKLFENFIVKYELAKELPEYGAMQFDAYDTDKYQSASAALENLGYGWNGGETMKVSGPNPARTNNRPAVFNDYFLIWNKNRKGYEKGYAGFAYDLNFEVLRDWPKIKDHIIDFEDYFKPTHDFRGTNLKKFGV